MRAIPFALVAAALIATQPALPSQQPDQLVEANKAASVLVLERLKARNPEGWRRLRRCPRTAILLVDGRHDHTDQVLRPLGLRYRRCSANSFSRQSLRGVRLLIVDCPGRIGQAGVNKAMAFVERGGTLLTTDWAVLHVLQRGFGGKVRYNGTQTRDDVVRVDHVASHPLTQGVFPRNRNAAWWLENRSYTVASLSSDVTVLFSSSQLARRYRSGIVGCTFPHGRGDVIHVVSHMYLQRTIHAWPWERRSAVAEAEGLDLPTGSDGYKRLVASGALGRIKAGDLNATLSIQQFLMNVVLHALGRAPRPHPPRPPRPPVRPHPVRPPPRAATHEATTDGHLYRTPGGEAYLLISRGLRLEVLKQGREWVRVRTPAGQVGWLPSDRVGPRR